MASRLTLKHFFLMILFWMSGAQDVLEEQVQDLTERLETCNSTVLDHAAIMSSLGQYVDELRSDVDSIRSNIRYIQNNIGYVQSTMVAFLQTGYRDIGILQDDVISMQNHIESLQNELESLNVTIHGHQSTGVNGNVQNNAPGEMEAFDVTLVLVPVTFTPQRDSIIKFNREFTNVHNGYNTQTGYYTAPSTGTYSFLMSSRVSDGNLLLRMLYEDGTTSATRVLCRIRVHNWNSASCGAVLHMDQGDKVYVKSDPIESPIIVAGEEGDTKFSGFMIQRN